MTNELDDEAPAGYVRVRQIGRGAFATVYEAVQTSTGRHVALKLWREGLDAGDRARFFRETDLLRELVDHPNVVRLVDAGAPLDGRAWLVTELCEQSLADRIASGPVPLGEAFALADDLLAGLAAVHARGHVHRDVKPQNVLLSAGRAKMCDLGVVTAAGNAGTALAGTVAYLAPELESQPPTVASDVYAAALTLIRLFGDLAPDEVSDLLTRASSARPADRPASVQSLRASLTRASGRSLDTVGAAAVATPPAASVPAPERHGIDEGPTRVRPATEQPARPHRWWPAAAAAAVLLVGTGAGAVAVSRSGVLESKAAVVEPAAVRSSAGASTPAAPAVTTSLGRPVPTTSTLTPAAVTTTVVRVSSSSSGRKKAAAGSSSTTSTPPRVVPEPRVTSSGRITRPTFTTAGECEFFTGTAVVPPDETLILVAYNIDGDHPDQGFAQVVENFSDPGALSRWRGHQFFNEDARSAGQRFDIVLTAVDRDEAVAAHAAARSDARLNALVPTGKRLATTRVTASGPDTGRECRY